MCYIKMELFIRACAEFPAETRDFFRIKKRLLQSLAMEANQPENQSLRRQNIALSAICYKKLLLIDRLYYEAHGIHFKPFHKAKKHEDKLRYIYNLIGSMDSIS